jgi:hypothetical protein
MAPRILPTLKAAYTCRSHSKESNDYPMTFSTHPIVCSILVLAVCTYLGSFTYLTTYLRRAHTATWVELGEFTFWDKRKRNISGLVEWYIAGFRTLAFVLFSNQHSAVQDRRLASFNVAGQSILCYQSRAYVARVHQPISRRSMRRDI